VSNEVWLALALLAAYGVGSISSGFLVARWAGLQDIRQHGSRNIGATNVLRTLGWRFALLVLVFDALKGVFGVLVVRLAGGGPEWQALGGIVAMLGHVFPFTLGFRGGRGVATGIGVLAALDPLAALAAALTFILTVALSRYVSLGSILAGIPSVLVLALRGASPLELVIVCVGVALIIWRHGPNIARLRNGTENRFSFKSKGATPAPPAAPVGTRPS
jgi:glycerol-3-phosphate acyltransferase PlsY